MAFKRVALVAGLVLMAVFPVAGQTNGNGAVAVPAGTKVDTIRFSDEAQTEAHLSPAEQVAFLFVYGIWQAEEQCSSGRSGIGRFCSLPELVAGVTLKSGNSAGLTTDPSRDSNYRYSITNIGNYCIITALPARPNLGAFAVVGTGGNFASADYYLNPAGTDLSRAQKLSELGYSGRGFRR